MDPRASCLALGNDGRNDISLVLKNSLKVRLYTHVAQMREPIESPYADGRARIVQVVQRGSTISVLYAWIPPETNPIEETATPESNLKGSSSQILQDDDTGGQPRESRTQGQASTPSLFVRYHLLHYNIYTADRPVFFTIPTHKSLYSRSLVPIHLAVHNRLQCAILWDVPDTVLPTPEASLVLYTAQKLPQHERGIYHSFVIYPFDHPAPIHRIGEGSSFASAHENLDESTDPGSDRKLYTCTKARENPTRRGDRDLRLLHAGLMPRAISFFKDGRRLFLYAPGSITPYTTILANEAFRARMPLSRSEVDVSESNGGLMRSLHKRIRRTNITSIYGYRFTVSLPFFSRHEVGSRFVVRGVDHDIPEMECVTNVLCLGTTRLPAGRFPNWITNTTARAPPDHGPQILTIVQVRRRVPYELCLHMESTDDVPVLPAPPRNDNRHSPGHNEDNDSGDEEDDAPFGDGDSMYDTAQDDMDQDALDGTDLRVVARLWGWNPHTTTLTGLDTVSASPRGERIAVAQWDRVLIYVLDPGALCEEVGDEGSASVSGDDELVIVVGSETSQEDVEPPPADGDGGADNNAGPVETVVEPVDSSLAGGGGSSLQHANDNDNGDHADVDAAPNIHLPATNAAADPPQHPHPHPAAPPSIASMTSASPSRLLNFYPRVDDHLLGGWVVEFRPIVLKMDGGAIVRKMIWGRGRPVREEETENGEDEDEISDIEDEGEARDVDCKDGAPVRMPGLGKENERIKDEDSKDKEKEKEQDTEEVEGSVQTDNMDGGSASTSTQPERTQREDEETPPKSSAREEASMLQGNRLGSSHAGSNNLSISKADLEHNPAREPRIVSTQSRANSPPPKEIMNPAPFSDTKLTGQIKKITRPPEYHDYYRENGLRIVFDPTPSSPLSETSSPEKPSGSDKAVEQGSKGKEIEEPSQEAQIGTPPLEPSRPQETSDTAKNVSEQRTEINLPQKPKMKRKRRKRIAENELIVLTDRDVQVWDLSVWGTGKRARCALDGDDVLL